MRVLVTGSEGYLGSVLVPRLAPTHHVVGADAGLFGLHSGLQAPTSLVLGWLEAMDLRGLLEEHRPEAIVHLASVSNDPAGDVDPALTWRINHQLTVDLATMAATAGVGTFVFASSASIYGIAEGDVAEDAPAKPLTPYAASKWAAEQAIVALGRPGFRPVAFRFGTLCGFSPRMRFDLVVNLMTKTALLEGRVRVWGGRQRRPLLHVKDAAEAVAWALQTPAISGVYNVCGGNHTVDTLAELVRSVLSDTVIEEGPASDGRSYALDCRRWRAAGGGLATRGVGEAIRDVQAGIRHLRAQGIDLEDSRFYTLRRWRELLACR